MGTQPIGFWAGFGLTSPQQTGQLITPVIMIHHCYYRCDNWFTGRFLSNTDRLAGAMHVTSVDRELSKWYFSPPLFGLQSHLQALVNAQGTEIQVFTALAGISLKTKLNVVLSGRYVPTW